MTNTWSDLANHAPDWYRTFGESMPMGFQATPDQIGIIRKCIRRKSQKPLDDYVESLPEDVLL